MTPQTEKRLKPEDMDWRFCGYCGKQFVLCQAEFHAHLNACEKALVEKVLGKIK
jgi:hypothetical protein